MSVAPTSVQQGPLWRSRWAAIGAAVAVTFGGGGLFAVGAASPESSVVSIEPVRILDTRDPVDIGLAGPFVSPVSQDLKVTGSVPTSTGTRTVAPAGATGVYLNVTPVGSTAAGFISVRPANAPGLPSTSNVNFTVGAINPNAVLVELPVGGADDGRIEITYDAFGAAGPTTDVLVDVVGYTTDAKLKALEVAVAAKANSADVYTRAYVDTALAAKADVGTVTMSQAPTAWIPDGQSPPPFFRFSGSGMVVSPPGLVNVPLAGPTNFAGTDSTLLSVTYCIEAPSGGASVYFVQIEAFSPRSTTIDNAARTAAGCYTVTPSRVAQQGGSFVLLVGLQGGGSLRLGTVTSTWGPAPLTLVDEESPAALDVGG